jgi:hypothetical protein
MKLVQTSDYFEGFGKKELPLRCSGLDEFGLAYLCSGLGLDSVIFLTGGFHYSPAQRFGHSRALRFG